jgi:hypothetical protein
MSDGYSAEWFREKKYEVHDAGEYVLVSVPPNKRCGYNVLGCNICSIIMRRNKQTNKLFIDNAIHDCGPSASAEFKMAAQTIVTVAARLKKRDDDYKEFIAMLNTSGDVQVNTQQKQEREEVVLTLLHSKENR